MKCIWLGQAGLLFDFDATKVMVDPYLSDSVASVNLLNKRRVEVDERFLDIRPDVLILTHDHLDHTDSETLDIILNKWDGICVLASQNAWQHVRSYGGSHNYVMFDRGTGWTQNNIYFQAVHAQHSDSHAIGVLITYLDKTYYVKGDTLYHNSVIEDTKKNCTSIDMVFLPVNGVGNNMNMVDAKRFCECIKPKVAVPIHGGLFDEIDLNAFEYEPKIVPQIYCEIGY